MDQAVTDLLAHHRHRDVLAIDDLRIVRQSSTTSTWFVYDSLIDYLDDHSDEANFGSGASRWWAIVTEVVEFLGIEIVVPSEDLCGLVRGWAKAPEVESAGRTFYRFASSGRCLVVAQDRRDELLDLLRSRIDSAEARAREFYARRDTPQESLRRLNEARGASIEYGPDRLGRFRSS